MLTVQVGELKARFSEFLQLVRDGEEIVISFGRRGERVAVLVPYEEHAAQGATRNIGVLRDKASFIMGPGFELDDDRFLHS